MLARATVDPCARVARDAFALPTILCWVGAAHRLRTVSASGVALNRYALVASRVQLQGEGAGCSIGSMLSTYFRLAALPLLMTTSRIVDEGVTLR